MQESKKINMTAKVLCAWCLKDGVETIIGELKDVDGVSHGICKECFDEEIAKFNDVCRDSPNDTVSRSENARLHHQ